jgi:NAD(P) transhydrogenase subunit alpha
MAIMEKKDLVIGVPKEIHERCRCVGVVPETVQTLVKKGHRVLVEQGAGEKAFYPDERYRDAGAELVGDAAGVWGEADVILKLRAPLQNKALKKHELDMLREGSAILSFLAPTLEPANIERLVKRRATGFAMELIPRISRAQSMDALSTLSSIAGYRAVLLAADLLGKFFPLLMTAAGTIKPANVLVVGAGVAGLQAIATARRLGAKIEAFDTRPAVREQIESLGARFIEMELPEDTETAGGYAKEVGEEFIRKEREAIAGRLPRTDVVITTALVYGRRAPMIITEEMIELMPPGSVIVDIAAESGGNCELTRAGETLEKHGVTIHGAVELPSQMPLHTSWLYSRNVSDAFANLFAGQDDVVDLEDEINRAALVTYKGQLVSDAARAALNKGGTS